MKHSKIKCLYCLNLQSKSKIIKKDIQDSYNERGAEILKLIDRLQVRISDDTEEDEKEGNNNNEKEQNKNNNEKKYITKIQTHLLRFVIFYIILIYSKFFLKLNSF